MKITQVLFVIFVCLAPEFITYAEAFTIGTFDVDRGGNGSLLSEDRTEIREAMISSFFAVAVDGASVLTEAWANTHDLLWLDSVKGDMAAIDPLSADEQQVLSQFVLSGGGVIIFTDTDFFEAANLSLLAPFGLVSQGVLSGNQYVTVTDPPASPVTDGAFGIITGYGTWYPGWYSDLGDHAVGLATLDANGQVHLAFIDRETMGTGAGGAVFMADHRTDSIPLMLNAVMAVTEAAIPTAVGGGAPQRFLTPMCVYPNPFNPRTTIEFEIDSTTEALLTVYSLDGVKLATLIDCVLEAGQYAVEWNGRYSDGRSLPSGIYLCRLRTIGGIRTARLALVR
jgi:hypothetical protein